MSSDKGHCCFIRARNQREAKRRGQLNEELGVNLAQNLPPLNCHRSAEWNIHADCDPPDMVTQSCTKHVGRMLSDKGHHSVWPVE